MKHILYCFNKSRQLRSLLGSLFALPSTTACFASSLLLGYGRHSMLLLGLVGLVPAASAQALNPDGTLRKGMHGSFDAAGYTMDAAPNGHPTFRPTGTRRTQGVGDDKWADGFTVPGVNGNVFALAVDGRGNVYAGGTFTTAGGMTASHIAKWNGSSWSSLGTGTNSPVNALAVQGGYLYAGGNFTTVGDGSKLMSRFGRYTLAAGPTATGAPHPAEALRLWPNPAHGTATVCLPADSRTSSLALLDALGRAVRHYPVPIGPEATLDLRGLPAGVYVLRGGTSSQRLAVE